MSLSVAVRHDFGAFGLDTVFDAPDGVTALFGRSGAGKTTLVNAIAGLLRPTSGRIVLDGQTLLDSGRGVDLPVHRRRLGCVFQEARLFPHLSVRQNLTYGRWFAPDKRGSSLAQVVEMLGIGSLLDRRPGALSGGEKQRVAIGRALLSNPRGLLMDEPLASLDDARKAEIMPYLERLRDAARIPIVFVSHDMSEVARLATTLVVLDAGRVVSAGPLGKVLADPLVAPALGLRDAGAVLNVRLSGEVEDGLSRLDCAAGTLWLPQVSAPVGTILRVRIAAQDIILSRSRPEGLSALNILPATIAALRVGDGPGALVQLRVGEDMLLARITQRSARNLALEPGMAVFAILKSVSVAPADIGVRDRTGAPSSGAVEG